jgi:hypothetical protein
MVRPIGRCSYRDTIPLSGQAPQERPRIVSPDEGRKVNTKMTFTLFIFGVLSINHTRQFLLVLKATGALGVASKDAFLVPLCDIW